MPLSFEYFKLTITFFCLEQISITLYIDLLTFVNVADEQGIFVLFSLRE